MKDGPDRLIDPGPALLLAAIALPVLWIGLSGELAAMQAGAIDLAADIFRWALGDETSVMFGFIYLGAAASFIWGFSAPDPAERDGQLVGFLAYDLVLIAPFADQFSEVSGGPLTSLIVYTAFVVYSGALAAY